MPPEKETAVDRARMDRWEIHFSEALWILLPIWSHFHDVRLCSQTDWRHNEQKALDQGFLGTGTSVMRAVVGCESRFLFDSQQVASFQHFSPKCQYNEQQKKQKNAAPIMRRITIFFMLRASKRLPPNKPFFVSRAESWSQSQQLSGGGDVSSNRLILSTEGTSCTVDVDCGCLRKHCVVFHSYFSFGAKCVFDLFTLTFDLSNLKHCLSLYVYAHLYT